jgi:hypothetical protein
MQLLNLHSLRGFIGASHRDGSIAAPVDCTDRRLQFHGADRYLTPRGSWTNSHCSRWRRALRANEWQRQLYAILMSKRRYGRDWRVEAGPATDAAFATQSISCLVMFPVFKPKLCGHKPIPFGADIPSGYTPTAAPPREAEASRDCDVGSTRWDRLGVRAATHASSRSRWESQGSRLRRRAKVHESKSHPITAKTAALMVMVKHGRRFGVVPTRARSHSYQLPTAPDYKGDDQKDKDARREQLATGMRGWWKVKPIFRFVRHASRRLRYSVAAALSADIDIVKSHSVPSRPPCR